VINRPAAHHAQLPLAKELSVVDAEDGAARFELRMTKASSSEGS